MTDGKLTLGQYFRLEREKRGITLEEIEKQTKISKQTLQFLEDDRLDVLPPRAFLRGFLQCIAKEFDMDAEELIRNLDDALAGYGKNNDLDQRSIRRRRGLRIYLLIVIAVVVAIILGIILLANQGSSSPRQSSLETAPQAVIAVQDTGNVPS